MIKVQLHTCKGNRITEGQLPVVPREGDFVWVVGIPHPVSHVAYELDKDYVQVHLGVCR